MKKSVLIVFVLLLAVLPMVLAGVPITVNTAVNHDVMISVYPPEESTLIESYKDSAGANGTVTHDFDITLDEVKIIVFVSKFGEKVAKKVYDDVETDEELVFDVYPEGYVPPEEREETEKEVEVEEVVNETEVLINDSVENEDVEDIQSISFTGWVSKAFHELGASSMVYYVVGFVFIFAIAVFMISKVVMRHKRRGEEESKPKEIRVRKLSEMQSSPSGLSEEIANAERKIKEAQEEINKLKNQDKIRQAERKLEEDRKALEALRSGSDE